MQHKGAGVAKKPAASAGLTRVPALLGLSANFGDEKSFSK